MSVSVSMPVPVPLAQELENSGVKSCASSGRTPQNRPSTQRSGTPSARTLESWRKSNPNGMRSLLALALTLTLALTLIPP